MLVTLRGGKANSKEFVNPSSRRWVRVTSLGFPLFILGTKGGTSVCLDQFSPGIRGSSVPVWASIPVPVSVQAIPFSAGWKPSTAMGRVRGGLKAFVDADEVELPATTDSQ